MVRRIPQRDTEGTIAWMLRFLEANRRALLSRKLAHRVTLRKEVARKTA
jgi:hypothetical protein